MIVRILLASIFYWPFSIFSVSAAEPVDAHYQLISCSVDMQTTQNPTYYHLPGVNTVISCEQGGNAREDMLVGTLHDFYNEGWRLVQVVNIDNRLMTKTQSVPYSWLYLERSLR